MNSLMFIHLFLCYKNTRNNILDELENSGIRTFLIL